MARDLALIVNPTSGRGKGARLGSEAASRLRSLGASVEVIHSRSASHATEAASEAAARHEAVVAMGGDGMVALVANGVLGTQALFGIVPAGSGNDFAAHLGLPRRRPLDALPLLLRDSVRTVDVGRIEGGRAFLCVAGGGFDSECNRAANQIRWARGTLMYVAAVFKTLRHFAAAPFHITLDGERLDLDAMFVAVGNARSYGGGMLICPNAVLDDGMFEVCIVGGMSRMQLLGQFPKLFKGRHVTHPAVTMRRAREVTLEADREFWLYADGEEEGKLPATLRVEPKALRVLAP